MERVDSARRFAVCLRCMFMLGVVLFGLWLWRSGFLDSALDRKTGPKGDVGDLFDAPGKPADAEPSSVVDSVVQSVKDAKDTVMGKIRQTEPQKKAEETSGLYAPFEGASLDYWKNAVAEDRPGKDRRLSFTGLVPDGRGGATLLGLEMGGGQPLAVRVLGPDGSYVPADKSAFNKLIAQTPYVVAREGRAYFCSAGQAKTTDSFPVPPKGGAFNPSREEFGALLDCLALAKIRPPSTMYRVTLVLEKLKKEIPVATIGFGLKVSREVFEGAVRSLVDDVDMIETLLKTGRVRYAADK